jgi:hypothetical protein
VELRRAHIENITKPHDIHYAGDWWKHQPNLKRLLYPLNNSSIGGLSFNNSMLNFLRIAVILSHIT